MEIGVGAVHFGDIKDAPFFMPIVTIDMEARMQIAKQIGASWFGIRWGGRRVAAYDGLAGDQQKAETENKT